MRYFRNELDISNASKQNFGKEIFNKTEFKSNLICEIFIVKKLFFGMLFTKEFFCFLNYP